MKRKILSVILAFSIFASMVCFLPAFADDGDVLLHYTFEKAEEGWSYWDTKNGAEGTYIVDDAYSEGKHCMFIYDVLIENFAGFSSPDIPIKGGKTYSLTFDARAVSNFSLGTVKAFLRYYDAENTQLTNQSYSIGTQGWKNYVASAEAPLDAVSARIIICTYAADIAGCYIDDVKFVEGKPEVKEIKGTEPKQLPQIVEKKIIIEKLDDGHEDNSIIFEDSFETGRGKWDLYGDAFKNDCIITDEDKATGKYSLKIMDKYDTLSIGVMTKSIKIAQGNTYSVTAKVKANVSGSALYIKMYDEGGNEIFSQSVGSSVGEWGTIARTCKSPEGAVKMKLIFTGFSTNIVTGYIDSVMVTKGNVIVKPEEKEYKKPKQSAPVDAKIVTPVDGKLVYNTYTDKGDTLSDYSYAGFYGGELELPNVNELPVVAELSPTGTEDDTEYIQAAVDKAYNEAKNDNLKVIRLKAGKYNINKNGIKLKSGIVLMGEGQGPDGTILYSKDAVANTNTINIIGNKALIASEEVPVIDEYIPSGSRIVHIPSDKASIFKVGDVVNLDMKTSEEWVKEMKMDSVIGSFGDPNIWNPKHTRMQNERIITAINGNEITLNFGTFVPNDCKLSPVTIYKISDNTKIRNVGVENLRCESYFNGSPTDENHAYSAVYVELAKNVYIRNVTSKYFYHGVAYIKNFCNNVTVSNCSALDPISQVTGSRRYPFVTEESCQAILMTGNYAYDARHDYATSHNGTGPIAFVDNISDSASNASETHAIWTTGVLYDNIYQITETAESFMAYPNRGHWGVGSTHGWGAGGSVMWNSLSKLMLIHDAPLGYRNFGVGSWGIFHDSENYKISKSDIYKGYYKYTDMTEVPASAFATKTGSPYVGDGYFESEFTPVNPRSIFKAQLAERFTGTINNARPNAPILVYPRPDKTVKKEENNITIDGIYQMGAQKVTIYVDDIAYDAKLNSSDYSFECVVNLEEGAHKIYATQTIDGVEGNKTADRFITVGKSTGENPSYLQSIYDDSKTRMITNDSRLTYDEYVALHKEEMESKITVLVNNVVVDFDVEPFESNGRVLVPMRAIFEAIDVDVSWDPETETATAVRKNKTVKITKDDTRAHVNDKEVTLDVPATIIDGRFVVPVRFVSEAFEGTVDWDGLRRNVIIDGGIKYPAIHNLENEIDVFNAIQSADDGAGSIIPNVFDNDYTTYWGALYDGINDTSAYGIFDMGLIVDIKSMYIAFGQGNKRNYNVDILVSDDNVTYTPVKTGHKTSGTTTELEEIPLNCRGRYVKLVGKGNSVNQWLNIAEVAFTGK